MSLSIEQEEIAHLLEEIAGHGGSVAERIGRVARKLKWEYGRTKRLWYREARRIEANELEQAREQARQIERSSIHAELKRVWAYLGQIERRCRCGVFGPLRTDEHGEGSCGLPASGDLHPADGIGDGGRNSC